MSTEARWAIRIEGVGGAPGETAGLLIGEGTRPDELDAAWGWLDALTAPPQFAPAKIDLNSIRSAVTDVSVRVRIAATPTTRALLLLPPPSKDIVLTSALTASATTVETSSTALAGTVVEVDYESILLGTHTGSGVYTGCTRAVRGSHARAHVEGAYVMTRPSWWPARRIDVYWIERSGGVTSVNREATTHLRRRPETDPSGTTIPLRSEGIRGRLAKLEAPLSSPPLSARRSLQDRGEAYWYRATDGSREPVLTGSIQGLTGGSLVRKNSAYTALMVGGTLTWARGASVSGSRPLAGSPAPDPVGAEDAPRIAGYIAPAAAPAFAVAAFGRNLDAELAARTGEEAATLTPTAGCQDPYHLLTIWAAFLFSAPETLVNEDVFDVLGPGWALGFPEFATRIGDFEEVIDATPEARADLLVVSPEGKPERVLEQLERELAGYGIYIVPARDGDPKPVRVGPADVAAAAAAPVVQSVGEILTVRQSETSPVDTITARVGEVPWDPGASASTTLLGPGTGPGSRAALFGDEDKTQLDFGSRALSARDGVAQGALYDAVSWRHLGVPQVDLVVGRPGQTGHACELGDYIRPRETLGLETEIYPDPDGETFTATLEGDGWIGQVISRRPLDSGALAIRLAFFNHSVGAPVLWRPPSLDITGAAAAGTEITTSTTSSFGRPGSDAFGFKGGDQVIVVGPDLAPKGTGTRTVLSVAAGFVQLSSAFDVDPTSEDFLELADVDEYDNEAHVAGYPRPWAYMSEGGALTGETREDRYG